MVCIIQIPSHTYIVMDQIHHDSQLTDDWLVLRILPNNLDHEWAFFEELKNILASFSLPSIKNDIIPLWPKDWHSVNSCCLWDASPANNKSDLFKLEFPFFYLNLNEGPLWHQGAFLGNEDSRRRFIRKQAKGEGTTSISNSFETNIKLKKLS